MGYGFGSLIINGIRAITLLLFPVQGSLSNVLLFFVASISFLVVASLLYFVEVNDAFVKRAMRKKELEAQRDNFEQGSESVSEFFGNLSNTMKLIWGQVFSLCINYVITFLIFPGLMATSTLSFITNPDWFVLFMVTLFNLFDTISRYFAANPKFQVTPIRASCFTASRPMIQTRSCRRRSMESR